MEYILRTSPSTQVELFCYNQYTGDHTFAVINRNKESSPEDPSTWGADAYICDPMLGKVFPASEYLFNLVDCVKLYSEENSDYAFIPFDPQRNMLDIHTDGYKKRENVEKTAKICCEEAAESLKLLLKLTEETLSLQSRDACGDNLAFLAIFLFS